MPQSPYFPPNVELGLQATLTAASTGTFTTSTISGSGSANGCMIRLAVTTATGTTPTVTIVVQGMDPVSGLYFPVASSTAFSVVTGGIYTLTVYPGVATGSSPTEGAPFVLPVNWRIAYTIAGTSPAVTGTISAMTITP